MTMPPPAPPSEADPQAFPIGRILKFNLIVVAAVQTVLFLFGLAQRGEYGIIGFMLFSMVYVAGHCTILGIVMIVKFLQGQSPAGMAYLATLGIVLLVGGGTCFLGALR